MAGEVYGQQITPERIKLYAELLKDLPIETIGRAFSNAFRTCKFFPTVADLRGQIQQADRLVEDIEAEAAWKRALVLAGEHGNDYALASAQESNDPALEAAVRAAGDWRWLNVCPQDQLPWAKKAFLEVYRKQKQAPHLLEMPSTEEGRRLLQSLAEIAKKKQLR